MLTRFHLGLALTVALMALPAAAQAIRPPASLEILAGHAGFVDDATIEHSVFGGAARVYLTPRVSVGPEVAYMRGPDDDRDWFFLGNLTWDVVPPQFWRPQRITPFLIIGAGFFRHSDRVGTGIYSVSEGAFAGGGGARVRITDRIYAMADMRVGWELHYRVTGGIGISM